MIIALDGFKKEKVTLCHESRYLNTLVLGQKGTGKSDQVLLNMFYQDLDSLDHSIFVFSSKGDTSYKLYALAKQKGRKVHLIKPETNNFHFNLLSGDESEVLEYVMVLFEHFFKEINILYQEVNKTLLINAVKVVKRILGDEGTMVDVYNVMTNRNGKGKAIISMFSKIKSPEIESYSELENKHIAHWFLNEYYPDTRDKSLFMFCNPIKMMIRELLDKETLYGFDSNEEDLPELKKVLQKKEIVIVDTEFLNYKDYSNFMGTYFLLKIQRELLNKENAESFIYIDDFQKFYPVLNELFESSQVKNLGVTLFMQETKQLDNYPEYKQVIMNNVVNYILLERISIDDYLLFKEQINADLLNRKRGDIAFHLILSDGTAKRTNGILYTDERIVYNYEKYLDYKKELPKKKKRKPRTIKGTINETTKETASESSKEAVILQVDTNKETGISDTIIVKSKPFKQVIRMDDGKEYLHPDEILRDE